MTECPIHIQQVLGVCRREGVGNFELGKISFMWLFNKLCIFPYRFVYLVRYCLDENEIGFISGVSETNQP